MSRQYSYDQDSGEPYISRNYGQQPQQANWQQQQQQTQSEHQQWNDELRRQRPDQPQQARRQADEQAAAAVGGEPQEDEEIDDGNLSATRALHLPSAPWEEDGAFPFPQAAPPTRQVSSLMALLSLQRNSREVGLQLRTALRDVAGEFSYVRVEGLKRMEQLLAAAVSSDDVAKLVRESQLYSELQVVPAVHDSCLLPIFEDDSGEEGEREKERERPRVGPYQIEKGPPMKEEVERALHVLEGCCLLDAGTSRVLALQQGVVKTVFRCLTRAAAAPAPSLASACLSSLPAMLLGTAATMVEEVEAVHGIARVASVIKDKTLPTSLRTQAAEFLLILATHASAAGPHDELDSQDGSSQVLSSIGEELGLDFGSYVEKLMEHSEVDGLTDNGMQRICASIVDAV